jgi:hypothetical protein
MVNKKDKLIVLDELYKDLRNELEKSEHTCNREFTMNKSKVKRLRLIITDIIYEIEKDY